MARRKKITPYIFQVKYHEDFEKTKGRGFTPVVDDPVTERVRKNTQVMSDAAYKGVHPHIVEMDRRPGIIVGKLKNSFPIQRLLLKMKSTAQSSPYNQENISLFFIFLSIDCDIGVKFLLLTFQGNIYYFNSLFCVKIFF